MGHKIIQKVYICDCCGSTPEDGEILWEMGYEYICEKCFEDGSYDEYIEAKDNKWAYTQK